MKAISCSIALLTILTGCLSANLDEPSICDTVSLGTFPGSPVVIQSPPSVSFDTQENFSNTLQKISQVTSSYSVDVTKLTLTSPSDLGWVSSVQVFVNGNASTIPNALMATYQTNTQSTTNALTMQVVMDSTTLLSYLQNPVTLTFNVVAFETPTNSTVLGANFCVAASASFTKSI